MRALGFYNELGQLIINVYSLLERGININQRNSVLLNLQALLFVRMSYVMAKWRQEPKRQQYIKYC